MTKYVDNSQFWGSLALTVLALGFAVLTPASAHAWPVGPSTDQPVCTDLGHQQSPEIVSDGAGGWFVVWLDGRDDFNYKIYAQHLNASGAPLWAPNGIQVGTGLMPHIVTDDAGGFIAVWTDGQVYAQRINDAGVPQWTPQGIRVSVQSWSVDQYSHCIVSDGTGGAIVAWSGVGPDENMDISTQRLTASGATPWSAVPVIVRRGLNGWTGGQAPMLSSDGSGGAVISWRWPNGTYANVFDLYAQRVDSDGSVRWPSSGVLVGSGWFNQLNNMAPDGAGGAIVSWIPWDGSPTNWGNVHAQRLDATGAPVWGSSGVLLGPGYLPSSMMKVIPDGQGGAICSWQGEGLKGQRLNASGSLLWGAGVSLLPSSVTAYTLAADGFGGVIIASAETRWPSTDQNIYAQRVASDGQTMWSASGVVVCAAPKLQQDAVLAVDGMGGAVVSWNDYRDAPNPQGDPNGDIYAQWVAADGSIGGEPPPTAFCTITASAGAGGTISPSGSFQVAAGTKRVFQITPNQGYVIASVVVDGASVGSPTTYTFNNVSVDHTITATFALTFSITSVTASRGQYNPSDLAALTVTLHSNLVDGPVQVTPTVETLVGVITPLPTQTITLTHGNDGPAVFEWTVPPLTGQITQININVSVVADGGGYGTATATYKRVTVVNNLTPAVTQPAQQQIDDCTSTATQLCLQDARDFWKGLIPFVGLPGAVTGLAQKYCTGEAYMTQDQTLMGLAMWVSGGIDAGTSAVGAFSDGLCLTGAGCPLSEVFNIVDMIPDLVSLDITCIAGNFGDVVSGKGSGGWKVHSTSARLASDSLASWPDSLELAFQVGGVALSDLAINSGAAVLRVDADSTYCTADSTGLGGVFVLRMGGSQLCTIRPMATRLFGVGGNVTSAATIRLWADTTGANTFVLFHRQASGEVVKLEYTPFLLDSGGTAFIAVSQDSSTFLLRVDQNGDGLVDWILYPGGGIVSVPEQEPTSTVLFLAPSVPNPSGGQTILRFALPCESDASLSMFDILGRRVRQWDWTKLAAGPHQVSWDGKADDGRTLPPGILYYRLQVGSQILKQKLIHLQ